MRALLTAPLFMLLLACGGGVDPASARNEVKALVEKYHQLYDQGDVNGVLEMLDPAISISHPPDTFLTGKDACGAQLQKDILRLKEQNRIGKRSTMYGQVHIEVEGNVAIATYVALVREDTEQAHTLFTRVFRHVDGKWKILTEHYTFVSAK